MSFPYSLEIDDDLKETSRDEDVKLSSLSPENYQVGFSVDIGTDDVDGANGQLRNDCGDNLPVVFDPVSVGGMQLPKFPLKVVVLVHFLLSVWAMQVEWLPRSYVFTVSVILAFMVWAMMDKDSVEPAFMTLATIVICILLDIIHIAIYYPRIAPVYENGLAAGGVSEFRFSVGMAILNLLLKPCYALVLYQQFTQRGGDLRNMKFGGGIGASGRGGGGGILSGRGYENLDHPSTPEGLPGSSSAYGSDPIAQSAGYP